MYNVYGSQNDFVDHVTRAFILRMRSLGQNGPLRRDTVFAVARIYWGFINLQTMRLLDEGFDIFEMW